MRNKKKEALEEKFWNGTISEAEEIELRNISTTEQSTSPALQDYIHYTASMRAKTLPASFDDNITQQIQPKSRKLWPYISIAAALLLAVSAVFLLRSTSPTQVAQNEFIDTYDNPDEAYAAVRAALLKVSTNISTTMDHTTKLNNFNRIHKKVKK